jgi:hypothetical protein
MERQETRGLTEVVAEVQQAGVLQLEKQMFHILAQVHVAVAVVPGLYDREHSGLLRSMDRV